MMACLNCGKLVRVPENRWHKFRCCSRKCGYRHQQKNNRVDKLCAVCGTSFSVSGLRDKTAKYCSRPCYYKAMTTVGSIEKTCQWCGATFKNSPSRDQRFCSRACADKHEAIVPAKNASAVRSKTERLGILKECSHCGYDEHIEVLDIHHMDKNRRNNSWTNLAVACANCHKYHHLKAPLLFRSIAEMYPEALTPPASRV